ncbi:DUF3987 domain-containing protein [Vibrio cholerae]
MQNDFNNTINQFAADLIDLCDAARKTPLAKFASELALAAKMPKNTTFLTVLSIFSSVACRAYRVNYEHSGSEPCSINFCGEQPVASGKSHILSKAQAPVFQAVKRDRKAIAKQLEAKQAQLDAADKEEEKELKADLKRIGEQYDALFEFITDATPEAIDMALSDSNGYFSVASAEKSAIYTLLGINYKDTKSVVNRDIVLKGWNGEYHSSKRKGRNGYMGKIVGGVSAIAQDRMIEELLKASDNSGVIERFILWSESSLLGTRDHTQTYTMDAESISIYHNAITELYEQTKLMRDYEDLPALYLSVRSWDAIKLRRNELEVTIGDDGENANTLLRGLIGKYNIHTMKIAACLHLSMEQNNLLIHDDRVTEAMEIVDSYIIHLKSLIGESLIQSFSERESAVLDFMKQKKRVQASVIIDKLARKKCFRGEQQRNAESVKITIEQLCERDMLSITNKPSAAFTSAMITLSNQ